MDVCRYLVGPLSHLFQWLRALVRGERALTLDGRSYVVVGTLGSGATCTVHRVRDARGEGFAVKEMLHASLVDVRREIEAHLSVRHPSVLPLLAWSVEAASARASASSGAAMQGLLLPGGEEEQCSALLLFPLALQGSLGAAIAAALRPRGAHVGAALGEGEALRHCASLARGLCALHAGGRSHRDVNPRNALLLAGGEAALADLGSCAPLDSPVGSRLQALRVCEEAAQRTSMPYRAPELWQCDPAPGAALSGAAADVWALGCTLYACLWGVSPFECVGAAGGGLRLCEPCHSRVLGEVAFPAASASQGVVQVIEACLRKDPMQRPSMAELAERLEGLQRCT